MTVAASAAAAVAAAAASMERRHAAVPAAQVLSAQVSVDKQARPARAMSRRPRAANAAETDSEDVPLEIRCKELRKGSRRSKESSREDDAPLADLVHLQSAKRRRTQDGKTHLGVSGHALLRRKPAGHQSIHLQRRVAAAAGTSRCSTSEGICASFNHDTVERLNVERKALGDAAGVVVGQALNAIRDSVRESAAHDASEPAKKGKHGNAGRPIEDPLHGFLEGPFKLVKRSIPPEWYIVGSRMKYVVGCSRNRTENYQGVIAAIHGALSREEIRTKSEATFMLRRMLAPASKELRVMDAD
mmetsp:Transcript_24532/g.47684  ORF Transcript_24532/g.47684 Transcript_24532/m.47684 type:complete len:301 (-) Transcript_24532:55-957(-)